MKTGLFFIAPFYNLAFNILVVFYRGLGGNLGVAIIVFTLVLKLITVPFSIRQINSAKKTREFQVKYKELQEKHKGDKEQLTKELAKLQSEYLPAQLGGCLPMILQILFFFQVYYVIINIIQVGTDAFNSINYSFIPKFASGEMINLNFLGLNLGQSAAGIGFGNLGAVWPYLLLVLLVGITQYFSGRANLGLNMVSDPKTEKKEENKSDKKNKKGKSKKGEETKTDDYSFSDAMQQSSQQMIYILPIMTMAISVGFPAGLSLYWTVTSGFVIIQQLILKRIKLKSAKTNENIGT